MSQNPLIRIVQKSARSLDDTLIELAHPLVGDSKNKRAAVSAGLIAGGLTSLLISDYREV